MSLSATLALLASPPLVNEEAVALSPTIGWLLLACAVVVFLLGVAQGDRWRRLWLRTEDPRALGLFRILFAAWVLMNVGGLWGHFTFLFTDEGIFSTDTARELLAREQFAGYGDGVGESQNHSSENFGRSSRCCGSGTRRRRSGCSSRRSPR
jgi:hypothetical protein